METNLPPAEPATATPPVPPNTSTEEIGDDVYGRNVDRSKLQKQHEEAMRQLQWDKYTRWDIWQQKMVSTGLYPTTQESLMEQAKLIFGLDPGGWVKEGSPLKNQLDAEAGHPQAGRSFTAFASVKFVALDGSVKIAVFQFAIPQLDERRAKLEAGSGD